MDGKFKMLKLEDHRHMSREEMFAEWVELVLGKKFLGTKHGFAIYEIKNDTCQVLDLFLPARHISQVNRRELARAVEKVGKEFGCKKLTISVRADIPAGTQIIEEAIQFGFAITSTIENLISLEKEI